MSDKAVETGHRVVAGGAAGESSTALDNLTDQSGTYQPGMAPLAASTNATPASAESKPDASSVGAGDAQGSGAIPDAPESETGAEVQEGGDALNYDTLTAAELRALCKARGLKHGNNVAIENLIASLRAYDGKSSAKEVEPDADASAESMPDTTAPCMIVLTMGATFTRRDKVFKKGVPTPCDAETAERLLKTGMFAKG
jgi:hypothetical protein